MGEFMFEIGPDDHKRDSLAVEAGWPVRLADSLTAAEMLHNFQDVPLEYLYERLDTLNVMIKAHESGDIEDDDSWQEIVLNEQDALLKYLGQIAADPQHAA